MLFLPIARLLAAKRRLAACPDPHYHRPARVMHDIPSASCKESATVHTCPHCQEPHIRHLALRWASRESPAQCPGCGRLSQVLADTSSAIAVFTWLGVLGSVVPGLAWDSIALSGVSLLVVLGATCGCGADVSCSPSTPGPRKQWPAWGWAPACFLSLRRSSASGHALRQVRAARGIRPARLSR